MMLQDLARIVFVIGMSMTFLTVNAAEEKDQPALPPPRKDKIRVLVVTGGHHFKHEPFFTLLQGYPDITYTEVVQPEAQKWFAADKADEYDLMVWYDLYQDISEQAKQDLVALLKKGKPLVALHHCIANYQAWAEAIKIMGGQFYLKDDGDRPKSIPHDDKDLIVKIADPKHPITRFMKDFQIHDEVYKQMGFAPNIRPLLTTDHPDSDKVIGWTHTYGKSPVVYLAGGHDEKAYNNPSFRRLVVQSIRWAAGKLPDPSEKGFKPLFNDKDLTGWQVMGDAEAYSISNGVLRSESGKNGQWLCSDRKYSDFILRLEWRVSKDGNSGVFIRCAKEGYPWITGNEIQISNEPRKDHHCTGALYGRVAVDPRPDESPEVWHEFEIQCKGPHIKIFADKIPVVDVDQRDVPAMKDLPRTGYLGLQDSHNPTGWIEYRNVRIKELKPSTK